MSQKVTKYELGAGPHVATRIEHSTKYNCSEHTTVTVEIGLFGGAISGHGNSAKEAADHLAEQLRRLAYLVEAHEGKR